MIHLGTQALEGSTNTHKKDFLSVTPESVSQTQTLDSGRKNLGREEQKKKLVACFLFCSYESSSVYQNSFLSRRMTRPIGDQAFVPAKTINMQFYDGFCIKTSF